MLTEAQLVAAQPLVRAMARGFERAGDVDDLTQEAMLVLWRDRAQFTGTDADALHFVVRIARRTFINAAVRCGIEAGVLERFGLEADYHHRRVPTPEDTLQAKETSELVAPFAAKLGHPDRRRRSEARKALEALAA